MILRMGDTLDGKGLRGSTDGKKAWVLHQDILGQLEMMAETEEKPDQVVWYKAGHETLAIGYEEEEGKWRSEPCLPAETACLLLWQA